MSFALLASVALAALPLAQAHVALWHPSMFGWVPNDIQQQDPVNPLYDLPFSQWWGHGYLNIPPASGVFMDLPAGGVFHGEVACNRAWTSYGPEGPAQNMTWACDGTGALHTTDTLGDENPKDVKGCGLAIAYESDITKVTPEQMVVFSTNYQCPWKRHVDFAVPADLPACPPGGCICSWNWVHSPDSGSEQIYNLLYRCRVTGATNTRALTTTPKVPNKCPTDRSNCTVGPKVPMYWLQAERNNFFQGYYDPPYYNGDYGFSNGAQTDLFANVAVTPTSASSSKPASSSSTTSTRASSSSVAAPSSTPASVPGYTYVGCKLDNSARALSGGLFGDSKMTPTLCASLCGGKAAYFGTENGNQCFCGSKLDFDTTIDASRCGTKCGGDSTTNCGGSYALSVWKSSAAPVSVSSSTKPATSSSSTKPVSTSTSSSTAAATQSPSAAGYTYVGCKLDNSTRALSGARYGDSAMTVAKCAAHCGTAGGQYMALEAGNQCFCANQLTFDSSIDASRCGTKCGGDSSSTCGGSWALSLWRKSGASPAASSSSIRASTSSSTAPAATSSATIAGYTYVGCKLDNSARMLSGPMFGDSAMTVALCATKCGSSGYLGLEAGNQCFCGSQPSFDTTIDASRCNAKCGGDASKTCGGSWALALWKKSAGSAIVSPASTRPASLSSSARPVSSSSSTRPASSSSSSTRPASSSTAVPVPTQSAISGYTYVGCKLDNSTRALSGTLYGDSAMTVAECARRCGGTQLMGLENGNQCFCSSRLTFDVSIDASRCSAKCSGDARMTCGGSYALAVWTKASGTACVTRTLTTTVTRMAAPTKRSEPNWSRSRLVWASLEEAQANDDGSGAWEYYEVDA